MSINLRRIYDYDAPPEQWSTLSESCSACRGRGKQLSATGDAIVECPDCEAGQITRRIPPVAGVEILQAGDVMHFSTRFVAGGQAEGWLEIDDGALAINGTNTKVVYRIKRAPGRYDGERIHYYDCEKMEG